MTSHRPVAPWQQPQRVPANVAVFNPAPTLTAHDEIPAEGPPTGSMHLHWTVQACMEHDPRANDGQGLMYDVAIVEVEGDSEGDALAEAKRILPGRRYYRVQRVAETCRLDRDLREACG